MTTVISPLTLVTPLIKSGESGIGVNFKDKETPDLNEGDHIVLQEIQGIEGLTCISEIKAEIKWVLKYPHSGDVLCGCEFIDISIATQKKIQQFVDS